VEALGAQARLSRSLVITGFMGAGKSTAVRAVARVLEAEPLDADAVLEERLGMPIPDFFDAHGEQAFREREEQVVLELLDRGAPVVGLGGGAVENPRIRAALRDHLCVWIDVDVDTCWRRVLGSARPLARDRDAFVARFARRRPLYEEVAHAVLGGAQSIVPALPSLRAMPPGARMAWATTAGGSYPVVVGEGLVDAPWPAPGRAFTVTDATVRELWARDADVIVPAGEQHKTLRTAEQVWHDLVRLDVTRGDHLRAVGGGVVGDLTGFCAATYQRGVPVVQVPTTLLAQVDAAIGGKTGVDLPQAKNYVGAYHQPLAVLSDLRTLGTLPASEHAAGYAEVVKTALIAGGTLWERVASGGPVDADVVFACARTKVRVVGADERDGGLRQVLNLGHTVAHAIETVSRHQVLHGPAVSLGLLAALRLSGRDALRDQVRDLLGAAGLPTTLPGIDAAEVAATTRRDKKRTGEAVPFVLVHAPGDVRHGEAVGSADLLAAVEELGRAA
jgi:shikimate kinase/3-dehydroquinate synthase